LISFSNLLESAIEAMIGVAQMSTSEIVEIVGLGLATLAVLFAYPGFHTERRTRQFLQGIKTLQTQRGVLNARALSEAPDTWKCHDIPLLTRSSWIPEKPIDLDEIAISPWRGELERVTTSHPRRRGERAFRPLNLRTGTGYSAALRERADKNNIWDGAIYALSDVDMENLNLRFSVDGYFAYLDTSEVLAYEAAQRLSIGRSRVLAGGLRRQLKDPFDFSNRTASLGVNTLTLRNKNGQLTFFLHQRESNLIASDSQLIGAVPAGEFTPSDRTQDSLRSDFSLWRNIMREYAEEFLDEEEARGKGGTWIDYDRSSPYVELTKARSRSRLRVWFMGIGLDPLTWKPELLTVSVINAREFDIIFSNMVSENSEGLLLQGHAKIGLPFEMGTVARYLSAPDVAPSAKSLLQLAWTHRALLQT